MALAIICEVTSLVPPIFMLAMDCNKVCSTAIPIGGTIGTKVAIALAIACDQTAGDPPIPILKDDFIKAWQAEKPAGTNGIIIAPAGNNPAGAAEAIAAVIKVEVKSGTPAMSVFWAEFICVWIAPIVGANGIT
jgi:hypothetical protein